MSRSSLRELMVYGRERLHGSESAMLDAQVLLGHASGLSRAELLANPNECPDACVTAEYERMLALRAGHMPVAYITHSVEFMSLKLHIDQRALIPRPDTETLAECALALVTANGYTSALELCTGSGCIALALAHYAKGLSVTATDNSADALALARENVCAHGLDARIELIHGDLFEPVAGRRFDILLANPPYIRTADIAGLRPNVREYEPVAALDGGADGLEFYRRICRGAAGVLNAGGRVLFETGYDQAEAVAALLSDVGFAADIIKDLSGHDRVVRGKGK